MKKVVVAVVLAVVLVAIFAAPALAARGGEPGPNPVFGQEFVKAQATTCHYGANISANATNGGLGDLIPIWKSATPWPPD